MYYYIWIGYVFSERSGKSPWKNIILERGCKEDKSRIRCSESKSDSLINIVDCKREGRIDATERAGLSPEKQERVLWEERLQCNKFYFIIAHRANTSKRSILFKN